MAGAVFSDVEGTLLSGSMPRLFVQAGYRMGMFSRFQMLQASALALLAKPLPGPANVYLRFLALRRLVKGRPAAQVERVIEAALPELLARMKPGALERLRAFQAEGRPVVLVSGALHMAVERLGRELGMRGEGTPVELVNGRYTGRAGAVCQGREKALRVREVARELEVDLAESTGYGDSLSDVPFLELVGRPVAVDPEPRLRLVAAQRGWEIIETGRDGPDKELSQ